MFGFSWNLSYIFIWVTYLCYITQKKDMG